MPGSRYGLGIFSIPLTCGGSYWSHEGDVPGYNTIGAVSSDGRTTVALSLDSNVEDPQLAAEYALVDHVMCRTTPARYQLSGARLLRVGPGGGGPSVLVRVGAGRGGRIRLVCRPRRCRRAASRGVTRGEGRASIGEHGPVPSSGLCGGDRALGPDRAPAVPRGWSRPYRQHRRHRWPAGRRVNAVDPAYAVDRGPQGVPDPPRKPYPPPKRPGAAHQEPPASQLSRQHRPGRPPGRGGAPDRPEPALLRGARAAWGLRGSRYCPRRGSPEKSLTHGTSSRLLPAWWNIEPASTGPGPGPARDTWDARDTQDAGDA